YDNLHQEVAKAGLMSATGLASDEAVGTMSRAPGPEELQLQALGGQGIEVTPLELANAYRALAQHRKDNRDAALGVVYAGLEGATDYGMAHAAAPIGHKVAGKTGT